ncbi:hypothetical protein, partial [Mycobacterium tuberculosis]
NPITVRTPPVLVSYSQGAVTSTSGPTSEIWVKPSFFPGIRIAPSSGGGATSTQGAYFVGPISIPSGTVTFPGFTIPLDPIDIGLPVSLTIPGFTIPGGTLIPTLPLGLALSNGIPPVDIPAIVLDRILLDLHADTTIGPINVPIAGFGGAPGFGNSTTLPSSGFFNTGAGGGSGFSNTGAGMSGLLNAMSDPLLGSASGFANFGTQLSGILNRGAGISGVYNTGALGVVTAAVVSGFGNVGQQLSGLLFTGVGP